MPPEGSTLPYGRLQGGESNPLGFPGRVQQCSSFGIRRGFPFVKDQENKV